MTKSERTVRALEDQFYGRGKDADALILKSLKKLDGKKNSHRKQIAAEASFRLK